MCSIFGMEPSGIYIKRGHNTGCAQCCFTENGAKSVDSDHQLFLSIFSKTFQTSFKPSSISLVDF